MTYADVLTYAFGEDEFTTKEVTELTGNSRPGKLLSELKFRGIVERVGHGTYRCLKLEDRPDFRKYEWNRVSRLLLNAPWPKAWTGSNAVERWTNGKYRVYPNAFAHTFDLVVLTSDHNNWVDYLKSHGISTRGSKSIGAYVELHPADKLEYVEIEGEPVISKEMTIKLIREHPGIYAGAEDLIED